MKLFIIAGFIRGSVVDGKHLMVHRGSSKSGSFRVLPRPAERIIPEKISLRKRSGEFQLFLTMAAL